MFSLQQNEEVWFLLGRPPDAGLCLLLGHFPIPTISATPGFVIPWNESVKILCWGTPESYLYQLEIMRNSTYEVVEEKLRFQKAAEFIINHMDTNTAGRYRCRYKKQYSWSEYSEALELVVTGEETSGVSGLFLFFHRCYF